MRTTVVTGANTGIGRATAHELARRGGRVVLACRSEERTRPVIEAIVAETGNDDVTFLPLDLGNLASVRRAIDRLTAEGEPIDVLVANAGIAGQRGRTTDGFELAFGTNHLGHFLFVTGVLPLLHGGGPSRVVVVASDSHYDAPGIDFEAVCRPTRSLTGLPEYAVSKLANVLFAEELARRAGGEPWVASVHPGVIGSDVWRRVPWPVRPVMTRLMKSPEQGAATSLLCATSADVLDHDGAYFSETRLKAASPVATAELAAELWRRSEDWTS